MKCLLLQSVVGSLTFSIGIIAVFTCLGSAPLTHSSRNTVFIIKPVTSRDTVLYRNYNYCSRGNPQLEEKVKKLDLEEVAMKKFNRKLQKLKR